VFVFKGTDDSGGTGTGTGCICGSGSARSSTGCNDHI
jgi:hypothetical protein